MPVPTDLKPHVIAVLSHAADLLDKGWITGALARSDLGFVCHTTDKNATCFCAAGAIDRAVHDLKVYLHHSRNQIRTEASLALKDHLHMYHASPLCAWNDAPGRTKEDVTEAIKATVQDLQNA